jgi:hypothetical protein
MLLKIYLKWLSKFGQNLLKSPQIFSIYDHFGDANSGFIELSLQNLGI